MKQPYPQSLRVFWSELLLTVCRGMENEDVVPMLVTLEDHLSEEFDSKLKGSLKTVDNDMDDVEIDLKKVPITILTGFCQ